MTPREGELEPTFSKQRAILRSLTAKAIEGDAKATAMVLDLVQRLIGTGPEPEIDLGSGPRGRLPARLAKVHQRLAADDPQDGS